jgi:hypothetical protein
LTPLEDALWVEEATVGGAMSTDTITVRDTTPLGDLERAVVARGLRLVPVVDAEDRVVGVSAGRICSAEADQPADRRRPAESRHGREDLAGAEREQQVAQVAGPDASGTSEGADAGDGGAPVVAIRAEPKRASSSRRVIT